jgi:hypothetical protein
MLKKVPVVVHALVEDYGTGDFKYCDSECPFMEVPSGLTIYCRLNDEREMIGQDEVAELRCQKCRENEALLTAPPDRDDAAMRDGVRVEATKDEKVKRLIEALRGYAECCDGCTCGDGWSHDAARSALAEVEKPEVDAEVTRCEVEK